MSILKNRSLWNKRTILFSSVFSSGINFVSSIVLTKIFSLELFGFWLSIKSFVQISGLFNLGVGNYLILKLKPPFEDKIELQNLTNSMAFASIPFYILFLVIGYFIYLNELSDLNVLLPFVCFAVFLTLSSLSSLNVRALRNGRKLLLGNLLDGLSGLIILASLFWNGSITFFLILQSIRYLIKFLYQFDFKFFKPSFFSVKEFIEVLRLSFPVHIRSWIQSVAQYGDKFLFPMVFGLATAGSIGFGSTLALPVVMLISATSVILIPFIIDNSQNTIVILNRFKAETKQVLQFTIAFSFLLPAILVILNTENHFEVIAGFWISVFINYSQFVSLWFFRKENTIKSAITLFILIIVYFLIIIMSNLISDYITSYDGLFFILICSSTVSFLSIKIMVGVNHFVLILISLISVFFSFYLIELSEFEDSHKTFLSVLLALIFFLIFFRCKIQHYTNLKFKSSKADVE